MSEIAVFVKVLVSLKSSNRFLNCLKIYFMEIDWKFPLINVIYNIIDLLYTQSKIRHYSMVITSLHQWKFIKPLINVNEFYLEVVGLHQKFNNKVLEYVTRHQFHWPVYCKSVFLFFYCISIQYQLFLNINYTISSRV